MSTPKNKTPAKKRPREAVFTVAPTHSGPVDKYLQDRYERLAMRTLVEDGAADFILARPNHPHFMRMLEFIAERGFGKVAVQVEQKITAMPAVALPAKEPEQIPDGYAEPIPPEAVAAAVALLPPKADGTPDHLDAPRGAADDLPHRE